jgi:uncharacterized protein
MIVDQRVSMISLGVDNLKRSRQFYEEGLGWQPSKDSNENIVFFQIGGMVLGLYSRKSLAEDAKLENDGTGFGGIALAHNVRQKADVVSVLKEAESAGAKILKPAEEAFWGGYSGYFADPDGHPWEVAWNPFWTLNDDGSIKLPA